MYTLFLHHSDYLDSEPKVTVPIMPVVNDWLQIPVDVRHNFWPGCAETLYVAEREHLFNEVMQYYGTRIYLRNWEDQ